MIRGIVKSKKDKQSVSEKCDRRNAFRISRKKNSHGFYIYVLENIPEGRSILIPRFIFGKFRETVRIILEEECANEKFQPFDKKVSFLSQEYFYFRSSRMDIDNLIVQDIEERDGSSGYITVSRRCLKALDSLLYSERIQHPNDVLENIVSYHKLFQFSFIKGSKSMTSDLLLRKDILQSITNYRPGLAGRMIQSDTKKTDKIEENKASLRLSASSSGGSKSAEYRSKLGERFHKKNISVDYDKIFDSKKVSVRYPDKELDNSESKVNKKNSLSQYTVPLSSVDIKSFEGDHFSFELSADKSNEFRNAFVADRLCDFYLGFEIVDTLFTFNKTLKSLQFPLYYMKVRVRESGREVHLESIEDGKIYLNHLALAHVVEKFSDKTAGKDQINAFFNTLLAQHISIDRINDRITLTRHLPVSDDIFDRMREVLFGYRDENGKGGILGEFKFNGIECDLHAVILYRADNILPPVDQALENDLDRIYSIAHHETKRFYNSLLGRFLTPELQTKTNEGEEWENIWLPSRAPRSVKNVLDHLRHHDLVLLEGPPGTGKTHTIMNLLIHCVCSKQRVLIVSDQQAAIEALTEKVQGYLVGSGLGEAGARDKNALLLGAIKIVDDTQEDDSSLSGLLSQFAKALRVPEQASAKRRSNLERKLASISEAIESLVSGISKKMEYHFSDEVSFEQRQPHKSEGREDIKSLIEFIDIVKDKSATYRSAIEAFISNRQFLIANNMEECYSFFKIPLTRRDVELEGLRGDIELLTSILNRKIQSLQGFRALTESLPQHELIRYLESVLTDQLAHENRSLDRIARRIKWNFRSSFESEVRRLLAMIRDQVAILEAAESWSDGLWNVFMQLHECIRCSDEPSLALALYFSLTGTKMPRMLDKECSIQEDLERIEQLYQQQEKLVYDQFTSALLDITQQATRPKKGGATNDVTRIAALIDHLQQFSTLTESGDVFEEFKQALYDTFPIWIVRKQNVPLLLPCTERSFDLVVIDEATQCRVDDALSLLYRAKKILVVGDEKQTVLQKNSPIDDYLFKDHELDEHLRSTQARAFKGGGSHIFSLVKSIKQASVMLDEHYRCPSDIIDFSNRYVYNNELKVMQWSLPKRDQNVFVDYSEKEITSSKKPTSGKFKGIETGMVDRFLDYISSKITELERELGAPINVETDVAICYFLLKNEPYVKHAKEAFLMELARGDGVLDGAGAALQGKERDYIFYLWDVTRYNIGAFKQGDDEAKRKGELNVLMSRPKKKAFHFLHRNFDAMDHKKTHITDYLWRSLSRQLHGASNCSNDVASGSESLLADLFHSTLAHSGQRSLNGLCQKVEDQDIYFTRDIVVGDPRRVVDLVALPRKHANKTAAVGVVDLSGFNADADVGEVIVDYYFQLKRALPKIDPVFLFPYEMASENNQAFRSLIYKLEGMDV